MKYNLFMYFMEFSVVFDEKGDYEVEDICEV